MELAETVRPLINAVYADVECWFIPYAAFPRFADLGDYNRSYTKTPDPKTGQVEPFIKAGAWTVNDIWRAMGVHMPAGAQINLAPIEAYNVLVNHKYQERSPNLPTRAELLSTLAPCFWTANRFAHVVPNYDRSFVDGVVPVGAASTLDIDGIGILTGNGTASTVNNFVEQDGMRTATGWRNSLTATPGAGEARFFIEQDPTSTNRPMIRADLGTAQVHISLANIDLARKTAAFDALRTKYEGHNDAEIIEMLMEGIRVPEFMERQPMLLASRRTQFSFGTRYATDGASLDQSVTNGVANVNFNITTPRTNTGGLVVVCASVVPDQMFERRRDNFLAVTDQDLWPKYERDSLAVEPVDQVLGADVDTAHATPGAIFGYEPLNHRWNRDFVRLGGDLYKPDPATAWSEDRAVLWVTEPVNPVLTDDWYLATDLDAQPFADRIKDHLTITTLHEGAIEGHTVFGPPLLEIPSA